MKVSELIDKLSKLDPNLDIMSHCYFGGLSDFEASLEVIDVVKNLNAETNKGREWSKEGPHETMAAISYELDGSSIEHAKEHLRKAKQKGPPDFSSSTKKEWVEHYEKELKQEIDRHEFLKQHVSNPDNIGKAVIL